MFLEGLSFGFGMVLINFSITIIVLEAGKVIGTSSVDLTGKLITITIYNSNSMRSSAVDVFLFPENANNILSKINKWMQRNVHYLMGVVILVIGIYLIWIGLFRLGII